jgi:hypothetical protein
MDERYVGFGVKVKNSKWMAYGEIGRKKEKMIVYCVYDGGNRRLAKRGIVGSRRYGGIMVNNSWSPDL